ncbi:MAG TPA: hypothetical protein VHY77_03455 [Acidimicrobiales bacterium]|nr:hypothetical protein [Acidimicrobiales bacterium]
MTAISPYQVDPADEGRHEVGAEPLWGESYYMDFVTDDGSVGGYVRLGWYPNSKVAWWTTAIVEPGGPSVLSVSYDAPATDPSITSAHGPTYSVELDVAAPLEVLRVRADAAGEAFADPTAVYRGETGHAVDVGIDLSWRTDGQPYRYAGTTRYEIPCLVPARFSSATAGSPFLDRVNGTTPGVYGTGGPSGGVGPRRAWMTAPESTPLARGFPASMWPSVMCRPRRAHSTSSRRQIFPRTSGPTGSRPRAEPS